MPEKRYLVYKQEYKTKISFRVVTPEQVRRYSQKGEECVAEVYAGSLGEAVSSVKQQLLKALSFMHGNIIKREAGHGRGV